MNYRTATPSDVNQLALLHAESWRRNYRGLFTDDFLDNEADSNRKIVWAERLNSNSPEQFVCVADQGGKIVGFVCAYGREDNTWGSLIDNLHVAAGYQRLGIGTQLMMTTFAWLHTHYPDDSVYLWVMKKNMQARKFYEKLGASNAGVVDKPNPVGGGSAFNCRYIWPRIVSPTNPH